MNVSNISFFHLASVYPAATEVAIKNVRTHHPTSFYYLGVDGPDVRSYDYLTESFILNYRHYPTKVGGPVGDYGYRLKETLEFLKRFRDACLLCNTSHIMMMEDDVLIVDKILIKDEWEHACADTKIGNIIPESVHDLIEQHCGKRPIFKQYGAGGGSIFKVSTFLENYDIVIEWFKNHFDEIQSYYPTIGYIDCFMNVYYYLCGKDYTVNPYRIDTHAHYKEFDYDAFVASADPGAQIVNNYKKYYYE